MVGGVLALCAYFLRSCGFLLFILLTVFYVFMLFFGPISVGSSLCYIGFSVGWVGAGLILLGLVVVILVLVFLGGLESCVGLVVLFIGVFGVFVSDSWFNFYVFYEGVVFPLFLFVLLYGGYYERVQSGFYLLVYTVGLSVPLGLYVLYAVSGCNDIGSIGGSWNLLLLGLWVAMLVKVPVYGLHGWLPKVHVEASTVGSIVLAGVMIKLGVYGGYLLAVGGPAWAPYMCIWWVLGGCLSLGVCLMVCDMNSVIAYSSVVHIAVVGYIIVVGLVGVARGLLLVSCIHGVVAVVLFYLVGSLSGVLGSRCVVVLSGLFSLMSVSGLLVFYVLILNIGFPLSAGFLGEIECFWCLVCDTGVLGGCFVAIYLFVGCCFNLYLSMVILCYHGSLAASVELLVLLGLSVCLVLLLLLGSGLFL